MLKKNLLMLFCYKSVQYYNACLLLLIVPVAIADNWCLLVDCISVLLISVHFKCPLALRYYKLWILQCCMCTNMFLLFIIIDVCTQSSGQRADPLYLSHPLSRAFAPVAMPGMTLIYCQWNWWSKVAPMWNYYSTILSWTYLLMDPSLHCKPLFRVLWMGNELPVEQRRTSGINSLYLPSAGPQKGSPSSYKLPYTK